MKSSKSEMLMMVAKMRGIKVSKKIKIDDLIREDKIPHTKSPF